jgi:hypothetical protein
VACLRLSVTTWKMKRILRHCLIHQEMLCPRSLKMTNVVTMVSKLPNFVRWEVLNLRKFKDFLIDMEYEYEGDVSYTEIRWMSSGHCLNLCMIWNQKLDWRVPFSGK